jgi:hypothetical protein
MSHLSQVCSTIVQNETAIGDVWQACITPNDGTEDGAENCSNNLTILATDITPPTINLISPSNLSTDLDGLVTFQYNATDPDSNVLSCELIINSTVKEMNNSITEDVIQSFKIGLLSGDYEWRINCTSEGGESSSETRTLTILSAIFEDTFTSAEGFQNDSTNTAPWERGNATQSPISGCYDDGYCWGTSLNANYYATGPYDDYLTQVNPIDLSNYDNVTLWFYHFRHFEDASTIWDTGVVDIYNGSASFVSCRFHVGKIFSKPDIK